MKYILLLLVLNLSLSPFAQNWQPLSSGTKNNLNSVYFVDANIGFAVGDYGTILKTNNGGIDWIAQSSTTRNKLTSVYFVNYNIGYAVGAAGTILKTSNGGNAWQVQNSGTTELLYAVCFVSPLKGYAVGPNGIYLVTIDGLNWKIKNLPYGDIPCAKSLFFTDSATGYAAGSYFKIAKTNSAGEFIAAPSVNACNPPLATHFSSINFADKNVGYATALDYFDQKQIVIKTNDAGLTWECQLNDPDLKNLNSIYFVDADTGYISGNEGTILKTKNGGANWIPINSGSSQHLNSVYFLRDANIGFIAGDSGTILKTGSCAGLSAPSIVTHPLSTSKCSQEQLTLNVSATNARLYLWQRNGKEISDANIINTLSIKSLALSDEGKYYCEIRNSCKSIVTDTAFITVKPLPLVNAGNDVNLCLGGKVTLSATGGNTYKWSPETSLSSTDKSNPIASPIQSTTYTVTATDLNNCSASDGLNIKVYKLNINAGSDKTTTCGAYIQFNNVITNSIGNEKLAYKWTPSDGLNNSAIVDPTAKVNANTIYSVEVMTENGCSASDLVAVSLEPMNAPRICILTVTNDNKNQIVWEKSSGIGIDSILIYRETNISNQFRKIGSVSYKHLNSFVDTQSNPDVQASSYKISLLDSCGFVSNQSELSKTIHLAINKGQGTTWNLIWNDYIGFHVNSYNIYRGTTLTNLVQIGSTTAGNTLFSDLSAPEGNVFYQIEVVSPYACDQTKSSVKSTLSNIASNVKSAGLNEPLLMESDFVVYPNPSNQNLIIALKSSNKILSIEITNTIGQVLYTKDYENMNSLENINISQIPKGIYFIKVITENGIGIKKILKE